MSGQREGKDELPESPKNVGKARKGFNRQDRLLVTGEPRDLAKAIHNAQRLASQLESAKRKADKDVEKLLKKIEKSSNPTKRRVFDLGQEFLKVEQSDPSKEKQSLRRLTNQILTMRPQHTKLCTMFLFAVSPYTRRVFATETLHDSDPSNQGENPTLSASYSPGMSSVRSSFDEFRGSSLNSEQLAKDAESKDLDVTVVQSFQVRLAAFQSRLQSRKHTSASNFEEEYASSPRKDSEQPAAKKHQPQLIRCRICENLFEKSIATSHFEECLNEYKDVYQEYRLENLILSVQSEKKQATSEQDRVLYGMVEQGLELIVDARAMASKEEDEFSLTVDMEVADRIVQAQTLFTQVLDSLEKDHRHASIKALTVESIDLAILNDPTRDSSPVQHQSPLPSSQRRRRPSVSSTTGHSVSVRRVSVKDFDFVKTISRGSVGRVFLAVKRKTGDIYAIKVMNKADVVRKNLVARIMAERNVLARARCPYIVKFFFSFETQSQLFLAMEFVQGGDILGLLNTYGVFPESVARSYASEIIVALKYLHEELQVCHRDLKPDNILIDRNGHVKLTDFGLSHIGMIQGLDDGGSAFLFSDALTSISSPSPCSPGTSHTFSPSRRYSSSSSAASVPGSADSSSTPSDRPPVHRNLESIRRRASTSSSLASDSSGRSSIADGGSMSPMRFRGMSESSRRKLLRSQVGTPDYMAPEILLGTGHDYACDWWSLGILVYEMLFGLPPFTDETPQRIFNNILSRKFPPNEDRAPVVASDQAWDLIDALLETDPEKRLGYAGAFEIQSHPFFKQVDWNKVEAGGSLTAESSPFVPRLASDIDTSYFRSADEDYLTNAPPPAASRMVSSDEGDCCEDRIPQSVSSGLLKTTSALLDEISDVEEDNDTKGQKRRPRKNSGGEEYPNIDFAYSQLANLQALNLAAASSKKK